MLNIIITFIICFSIVLSIYIICRSSNARQKLDDINTISYDFLNIYIKLNKEDKVYIGTANDIDNFISNITRISR